MDDRLVICFRAAGGPGRGFLERARALDARVSARGGSLVAFEATRITFAFDGGSVEAALGLVTSPGEDTISAEAPWAVGLAQGDLDLLAGDGSRGELAWGPPLVVASALAAAAVPGEILCAESVRALRLGELLGLGTRVAREGGRRVRGVRLDPARPFRRQAVEQLSCMRVAPLLAVDPARVELAPGALLVVRADPGAGGTRLVAEVAARAPRALVVSPVGSGFEPLGALRRALARSITRELSPVLLELAEPLESLLSGEGVTLEMASRLVEAFLWRRDAGEPALVAVDDARAVDPGSLEACARAALRGGACALVARLDATSGLPSALASAPRSSEIELAPLTREDAEAMAGGCTNEALDAEARRRWARLGGNVPLGIVESVSWGIVTGEIAWRGGEATPRSRAAGRGKVRSPAEWILLRAQGESGACRTLLGLIALLGGEAKLSRLARVLDAADANLDVEVVIEELVRGRWLVDTQEDWVALPSRTHRDALATLLEEHARMNLHRAAASVIAEEEGVFGRVDAAWHAARADDPTRASRILLGAARATADAGLEASTTQLIAFARRVDPSCEEGALQLLANALSRGMSLPPPPPASRQVPAEPAPAAAGDSEPPTVARLDLAPPAEVEPEGPHPADDEPGSQIANRLGELARDALLGGENAALERWVDGLRAAGDKPVFTERMRAMARLGRGDIGDALRVLRRTRSGLGPTDHVLRCQTSLAMAVALSAAGRVQEALLEGMDALARARQSGDDNGARACLAFLAKLYTSVGRTEEAERLREVERAS